MSEGSAKSCVRRGLAEPCDHERTKIAFASERDGNFAVYTGDAAVSDMGAVLLERQVLDERVVRQLPHEGRLVEDSPEFDHAPDLAEDDVDLPTRVRERASELIEPLLTA